MSFLRISPEGLVIINFSLNVMLINDFIDGRAQVYMETSTAMKRDAVSHAE